MKIDRIYKITGTQDSLKQVFFALSAALREIHDKMRMDSAVPSEIGFTFHGQASRGMTEKNLRVFVPLWLY
ncbi:MAG: hypothetical protein JXL81_04580 [Deltaproteobacteria bacterium]|nr:hypothetical protein [Deltaproteobacteria bacterium]